MDKRLYAAVLRYLGKRPHSEKEVSDFLEKRFLKIYHKRYLDENLKKILKQVQDDILEKLKSQKFLDDLEFGKWWIEQRTRIKPKGWRAIKFELKSKGLNKDILDELRSKNYELREKNEKELAFELAKKKMRSIKNLPSEKIYSRIGGFLARRGFDLDIIKTTIDELLSEKV